MTRDQERELLIGVLPLLEKAMPDKPAEYRKAVAADMVWAAKAGPEEEDTPAITELQQLVLGLYEDDKPRKRAIRRACRFLVRNGVQLKLVVDLAEMLDP